MPVDAITQALDAVAIAVRGITAMCRDQILGLFLAPFSSFSVGALAISLVIFVMLAVPFGRRRPVRFAVLRRALFPRRLWRSASGRADLAYFTGGVLFAGLAIGWALLSAGAVRGGADRALEWLGLSRAHVSLPASLVAVIVTVVLFLVAEFAYWLDHMLKHKVPLLWHFHKVHHQAESLSLLTNGRVHPIDTILYYNLAAILAGGAQALLGRILGPAATPALLGQANLLTLGFAVGLTHLQHSHLWVGFGPRWGRWLLGPAHHQVHHSADPAHFDRNFGSSLALFDRAFGTFFLPGRKRCVVRFGVDDGEVAPHGFRAALWQPFADSARSIARPVARLGRRGAIAAGREDGDAASLPV